MIVCIIVGLSWNLFMFLNVLCRVLGLMFLLFWFVSICCRNFWKFLGVGLLFVMLIVFLVYLLLWFLC